MASGPVQEFLRIEADPAHIYGGAPSLLGALVEVAVTAPPLAYHRRARSEASIGQAVDEVDRQIEDL